MFSVDEAVSTDGTQMSAVLLIDSSTCGGEHFLTIRCYNIIISSITAYAVNQELSPSGLINRRPRIVNRSSLNRSDYFPTPPLLLHWPEFPNSDLLADPYASVFYFFIYSVRSRYTVAIRSWIGLDVLFARTIRPGFVTKRINRSNFESVAPEYQGRLRRSFTWWAESGAG